jgi:hypothetical protein
VKENLLERQYPPGASEEDVERAHRLLSPADRQVGPRIRWAVTRIIFNNLSRSGAAGLRGPGAGPVRQFILRDDEYDIHIKIWGDPIRRQIRGQLLPRSGKGFAPLAKCHLLHNGARFQSTFTDETGEFHFDEVPEGDLYIQIDLNGLTIVGSLNAPH